MAFITKSTDTPCYSCSKHCISLNFCDANSFDATNPLVGSTSFTRSMRVSIIANPDFWGFGTKATNVLISGWATYGDSFYDYFDDHDKDHEAYKDCGITAGFFKDEQRPDVIFRSVYNPDTGLTTHYNESGNPEATGGAGRGGAEVYLVDRSGGLYYPISGDQPSCENDPPHQSFRTFPENFGWGNKINFSSDIYRNISAGWRLSSIENCYGPSEIYKPSGYLVQCSGDDGISKEKQNIAYYYNRYDNYEKNTIKGFGVSLFPEYSTECRPDGGLAGKYKGRFYSTGSIYRNISESSFMQARLSYGQDLAASGLRNGMSIGIKTRESGVIFDNVYTIFDVSHESTYTSVKFAGTSTGNYPLVPGLPTGEFTFNIETNTESGHWLAFNTVDPQTCCGLAAYGVSDENKTISNPKNYHTDFRRVFNNPKNLRQSNIEREWRYSYGFFDMGVSGVELLSSGVNVDYSYPSVSGVEIDGTIYGYPIIVSGENYLVATGNTVIESGYGLYEREKSYYGWFMETDKYDSGNRIEQVVNRGKGNNATCYSKQATLEIFPDCYTQYDKYEHCNYGESYAMNRIPRLAFVYRGCDFNDNCSFDDEKRPLGAWKNQGGVPTNMNDLKRLLGGQEIHMFLNLGNAWGGRHSNQLCLCSCDDSEGGYREPEHVTVRSPMKFPSFPNFDLNPVKYGCKDARHQISSIINLELFNTPENSEYCDPLHTSENVCRVRQPYTTYGYMLNLCGKQTNDRKAVLESFNKRKHQKTYTNANYEDDTVEPMYWSFTAPNPAPYNLDNTWSSGTLAVESEEDTSGIPFNQVGGDSYGFWGLADNYGNLVAPYFCTQRSTAICGCNGDPIATNLDYSVTGTFQNVLNTDTGWPTDAVPFLIELEVEEGCNSCASTVMDDTNLVIELSGLPGEFIWNNGAGFTEYGQYGHNYCKYGRTVQGVEGFGKSKYDLKPPFNCTTGFDTSTCFGDGDLRPDVWASYTGNTCECANGFQATLYPVKVQDSELILGFTSNPDGDAAGLLEIPGCADLTSSYFSAAYDEKVNGGYRIWAQFDLACGHLFPALLPPEYPDLKYEGDPLASIWGVAGCSHSYPAGNSDLTLQTTLWMIDVRHESVFRRLSSYALRRIAGMNLGNGILHPPTPQNFWGNQESNYFGLCPGDYVYTWGCKPAGTYFYGEQDDDGRYAGFYTVCNEATPCNTCPVGTGPDQVTCVCGSAVGYEGVIPHPMPLKYQLNECDCLCTTPYLIAKYSIDPGSTGMTLVDDYGNDTTQAVAYWMSYDGIDPVLIVQGPPARYMGIRLKYGGGSPADWHDWSHGVNGIVNGITHDLYKPYLGRDYLLAGTECRQLSVDHSLNIGRVIDCEENTECSVDPNYYRSTCGVPIYSSGVNFNNIGYPVRRKKCAPEVAVVTKVVKSGSNFKLYIAREYYEHDRTWYEQRVVGTGDEADSICVPVNQGAYEYNDGTDSGCYLMPYSTLADIITPVSNAPCSIHPSSGIFVNQDYQYSATGLTYDSGIFPFGSYVWNYYNLFYKDGFEPVVNYGEILHQTHFNEESGTWHCTGIPYTLYQEVSGKTIFSESDYNNPVGMNGIFATTGTHSCVQDHSKCGGDLWCNKLFFPRRRYSAGTLISPFGGTRICTSRNTVLPRGELDQDGYSEYFFSEEFDLPSFGLIEQADGIISEMTTRFVDVCSANITQESVYDIDIDDDYLIVQDYLPLMGVVHPGWRYTSDIRSCTIASGNFLENIQTHTNQSIAAGIFKPKTWDENKFDSMGYYLDSQGVSFSGVINSTSVLRKAVTSDNCIFNPFKILIDVECNTNRIRRKNVITDSPTLLQGVQTWDARACLGIIAGVPCSCGNTQCKYGTKNKTGECTLFRLMENEITIGEVSGQPCVDSETPVGLWYHNSKVSSYAPPSIRCNGSLYSEVLPHATISCDGKIFRMSNSQSYVKMWTCNENQYLHKHPGNFITFPDEICDCQAQVVDGLCNASHRCTNYTSCDCNPIPSGYLDPPTPKGIEGGGQWWSTDCECDKFPQDDSVATTYCRDSLIKWTITESI